MKTNIQIFTSENFGEIRTCQVNNQIMFVGKDVATALGYKNPSNALQVHVDSEDKTSYLIQVSGSNYKANTLFVNESGLYALILSSKLPQAKAFKRQVTVFLLFPVFSLFQSVSKQGCASELFWGGIRCFLN